MKRQALKHRSHSAKFGIGVSAAFAAVIGVLASPLGAEAKIRCNGPFQVIKGVGPHATPYCEDNYLATIARRTYGMKVSNKAVRNNPSTKARVCRHVGHDYRLTDICANHRPGSRRGGGLF